MPTSSRSGRSCAKSTDAMSGHHLLLLSHVGLIAFAGVVGHVRLWRLLLFLSGRRALARRILTSWLAINLFLGCQLSWSLRPIVGSFDVLFTQEKKFFLAHWGETIGQTRVEESE
ncbi:MAG: hypothetical protein V2A76_12380 [Planctomycetota bacterium]